MNTIGSAVFYDGQTSARHPVAVKIAGDGIEISSTAGGVLARWGLGEIARLSAQAGVLRIGRVNSKVSARLEIRDAALAAAFEGGTRASDPHGLTDRRTRTKVVSWSVAAVASLVAMAIWGVPWAAQRIAPHLPIPLEMRLGDTVDAQIRHLLDTGAKDKPFECDAGAAGARAALAKLSGTLEQAAELPLRLRVVVVRRPEANAIALPGGRIYVFEGLLSKAQSADEVAGVLAHEIGHVAHRDGTKSVLETAGTSLLFGLLLGDFSGGTAAVIGARTVLHASYSRGTEAAADEFGARLMSKVGGDPRALGNILLRISGAEGTMPHFLLDHPEAKERAAAIDQVARPSVAKPLLTSPEWASLKKICGSGK